MNFVIQSESSGYHQQVFWVAPLRISYKKSAIWRFFEDHYLMFLTTAARRDFLREAVFFLITFVFAALSIAWYALESAERATFLSFEVASARTSFSASLSTFLRRSLPTFLRFEPRTARFADLVIAIFTPIYTHF